MAFSQWGGAIWDSEMKTEGLMARHIQYLQSNPDAPLWGFSSFVPFLFYLLCVRLCFRSFLAIQFRKSIEPQLKHRLFDASSYLVSSLSSG